MTTVISVEDLSKSYRLGQIGTGTLTNDLKSWWAKLRGMPNPLLKIGQTDHVSQDGETVWALKDVSFQVEQGEVLGIIGRNGAGKSTLLKILSRVTAPTSGQVKLKGRIASLLEVGTGFHPELTGRENIYLNGAILGMNKEEVRRKFDEIVAFAEVDKFVDTPVKRYSSGMYVRLAFSVAAHLESDILLVDEVLAVGDAEFQKKCLGKMGDVASAGRTILFVSHNMSSVQSLCSRGLILNSGKTEMMGKIDEVIPHYFRSDKRETCDFYTSLDSKIIAFKKWWVVDPVLGQGNCVHSMKPFTFFIEYETISKEQLKNVSVSITIKNNLDTPILTCSNLFTGQVFLDIPERGVFACNFESLPLIPGEYKIKLWCGSSNESILRVDDAGSINVIQTDLFGSGKLPRESKQGIVVTNHQWGICKGG